MGLMQGEEQGKGEIIYTVGLPGSGKSTWAKEHELKLRAEGVKVVRIELDEMREEFGVPPDGREGELFAELLRERQRRIDAYLNQGYTIILSDTHLSLKALEDISRLEHQGNVSRVTRKDFTHVSLETCIQRNLGRKARGERYVTEEVLRKIYSSYMIISV